MNFKNARVNQKIPFVQDICKTKNVLDVGCVGQDNDFSSEAWVHKHLKSVSASLLGVDINKAGIEEARKLGYNILHVDELKDKTFDVITMLDVIEHVNDICQFLEYYSVYLERGGKMVITTPNPFNVRQFFNILLFGLPSKNPEHTTFIDPINFKEISNRLGMEIDTFCWLKEYDQPQKLYMKILQSLIFPVFRSFRKHFEANYAVVLTKS
ncbi:MAG TPA: methyltransferase domain-containing protein [Saprospiraceae bacterium]|nr:methyltransferase domain-containing protein [Saprospiraceae bacterium]